MSIQNPWRSIWFHPRETIRAVVEENPRQSLWVLAFIYGFAGIIGAFQALAQASQLSMPALWGIIILLSPILGYIRFIIASWVVLFTGRFLKGKATFDEVRASYAWSSVPLLFSALIWCGLLFTYGQIIFAPPDQQKALLVSPHFLILQLALIGTWVLGAWRLVLFVQGLAEVQRFSILRSVGNVVLSWVVMVIAFLALGLIMSWAGFSFSQTSAVSALPVQSMIDSIT